MLIPSTFLASAYDVLTAGGYPLPESWDEDDARMRFVVLARSEDGWVFKTTSTLVVPWASLLPDAIPEDDDAAFWIYQAALAAGNGEEIDDVDD